MVRSTLVTAWFLADWPTRTSPFLANATTEGVVREPSELAMTVGSPPSRTATTEFVVPRSIPTARAMGGLSLHCDGVVLVRESRVRVAVGALRRVRSTFLPTITAALRSMFPGVIDTARVADPRPARGHRHSDAVVHRYSVRGTRAGR